MVDGRKILIDRRAVAFVYQRNLHQERHLGLEWHDRFRHVRLCHVEDDEQRYPYREAAEVLSVVDLAALSPWGRPLWGGLVLP